ncbi:unnamed protein product [Closterium sp. Yama58-4]|nr:unnamed protein product [Closterium sp. Yama58-4]
MAASQVLQTFVKRQQKCEAGAITSVVHKEEVEVCATKSELLLESRRNFFDVITTDREGARYHEQSYPALHEQFAMISSLSPPPATDIQQAAGPHGLHLPSSAMHQVPLPADRGRILPQQGGTMDYGSRLQPVGRGTELALSLSLPEPEPDSSRPVPSSESNRHQQQQRKRQRLVLEQHPLEPSPLGGGKGGRFISEETAPLPAAVRPAVTAQKDLASLMLGCLHSESLNSTLLLRGPQAAEPTTIGRTRPEVKLGFPSLTDSVAREVEVGVRRTPASRAAGLGSNIHEAVNLHVDSQSNSTSFANFQEPSSVREALLVERLQEAQERAKSENRRVKQLERQVALMLREMGDAQQLVAGLARKNAELQGEMAQLMLAHMVVGLAEAGAGGVELGNRGEGGGEAGGMEEGRGDSEEVIQPSSRQM